MLRKYVLELSWRSSTKRFPRNLGAQRFHLSSSRKASPSGLNGDVPGATPLVKPDASPPEGKPDGSSKVGAFLVPYQTGYLDQYLGNEKEKLEESRHLNEAPVVEDSTRVRSSSMDGKAETQHEVKSDIEVHPPESDPTPERFTYNSTSEADNVRLQAVPKPEDTTVAVNAQSSLVHREREMDSASPKAGIEQELEKPGFLLQEYNLKGNGTESIRSPLTGELVTKETEALSNSTEGLKDGYMTKDGKLVLDFLDAIHAAEERQSHLEAQVLTAKLRALKEKYENELRDLKARELMRIEEATILDKELKREKNKSSSCYQGNPRENGRYTQNRN